MKKQVKKLILAPMEGVIDALMRELLTSINEYDLCITEFVRVVKGIVPNKIFYRICPELQHGAIVNKTPIRIQLLGQHPQWLAENANKAIELGSHGVDINFGCPAKTVNKSKGGAVLLQDPELIYKIMLAVKQALGNNHIASAKIRLGYDNTDRFTEIVDAIKQAGTDMLTIHARTKTNGYKPPAFWPFISKINNTENMVIIANGEIWSAEHAMQCIQQSNTQHLMLGRGALALPNLANVIKYNQQPMPIKTLYKLLTSYCQRADSYQSHYYLSSRLKQWFRYLTLQYPELNALFYQLKPLNDKSEISALLNNLNSG